MKYTETELRVGRGAQGDPFALEGETKTIAHVKLISSLSPDREKRRMGMEETEGNAERLAACWNFCQGISTECIQLLIKENFDLNNILYGIQVSESFFKQSVETMEKARRKEV